jgi:hypothetical protein
MTVTQINVSPNKCINHDAASRHGLRAERWEDR